ncbi:MAG: hypothetical protein EZS28_047667, partial [Streblomastix strix]
SFQILQIYSTPESSCSSNPFPRYLSCYLLCQYVISLYIPKIRRLSGGGELPLHFVDVEKTNTLVKRQWSKVAPEWRIAGPGITNQGCWGIQNLW